ncbi:MAG TPA: DHA2 family efflux MFS transporter permease subunit [Chthonomonas sp.]|uniref:DHA2 family efflux MFS transporter permease subunit n=1 Tax=Chthonomonas sp. TaxID=2282153 RepID=UPI002B4B1AE8|nr:DHA2 family efflux MFS transporter permease subunit [Chthonomonas sp.]HLI47653.1 DHA2 family efflux MFS transporter permease subunit [Chthonomonas sp.]
MAASNLAARNGRRVILTDTGEELSPYRWIILVGLITTAILEVLDTTIVNVSLPQMAGNVGATTEEISWVATGYILSNVIVLPLTAWLASRFGRKRYLVSSIILFISASFMCGTSRTLGEIVFWRIIQGAGGAAFISTVQATIREIFPREQQGTVQAIYVMGVIIAPTLGPTIGGWITDNYTWPWIFFVNVPIGIVAALIIGLFLTEAKHKMQIEKVDWLGISLLAVGLGSLQYVLEEGNRNNWFDDPVITRLTILSVVALIAMVIWELSPRNTSPVVNFRVTRNRDLSAALVLFLILGFGLYGGVFLYPLFAQNVLGFTATLTGLVLMPGGIATGIAAMFCGRMLNGKVMRADPRLFIWTGLTLFIYSMWSLAHLTPQSGEPAVRLALIIRGLGLGLLFTPINLVAFNSLKGVEIAQGASLLNLCRQLGGSFGIAILSTYLDNMERFHAAMLTTHLYPENPYFQSRLTMLQNYLMTRGYDPTHAHKMALALISYTVQNQAATMAFNNAFLLIGLSTLCVSPLVLIMRVRRKPSTNTAAEAMH